jgi:hypothetical protein
VAYKSGSGGVVEVPNAEAGYTSRMTDAGAGYASRVYKQGTQAGYTSRVYKQGAGSMTRTT